MTNPWLLSVVVILLAVGLYGALHSWLASLQVKAKAKSELGAVADRGYRLFYNVLAFLLLLPVLALPKLLPDRTLYSIPMPWILITLAMQGLALLALLIGVLQTGVWSFLGLQQLFGIPDSSDQLVRDGLYRYVRHPLYTAGLVLIWLAPVMTTNILALDIGLTIYILIGIEFEERKLVRIFGPAYEAYRRVTPKLLPTFIPKTPVTE